MNDQTELLTNESDLGAYRSALRNMITNQPMVAQMGPAASGLVHIKRSAKTAEQTIRETLNQALGYV